MNRTYHSTRSKEQKVSSSHCIAEGLCPDGGLYIPENMENMGLDVNEIRGMNYRQLAAKILGLFLTDFSDEQIQQCVAFAYCERNFSSPEIFPMTTCGRYSYLELYSGRTLAFKDAALSILPHLMRCAKENLGRKERTLILTATSGDTGKAAMEGFGDTEGNQVIVFYPYQGVSRLQEMQMRTGLAENTQALAIRGNFDDAQSSVKALFADEDLNARLLERGVRLSSANSINLGRLVPQVVYYWDAYRRLMERGVIESGEAVDVCVPTGNFGNILAGFYAKKMGLPIRKLICASNENNVLFDFFSTGCYDRRREFKKTISPSMDILVSSNLERLIYEAEEGNVESVKALMENLKKDGVYSIEYNTPVMQQFAGGFATQEETKANIGRIYRQSGYLMDPHTAVAQSVADAYYAEHPEEKTHCIVLSTASPFKFAGDVLESIGETSEEDGVKDLYRLSRCTGIPLPAALDGIEKRPLREETVIDISQMKQEILKRTEGKK